MNVKDISRVSSVGKRYRVRSVKMNILGLPRLLNVSNTGLLDLSLELLRVTIHHCFSILLNFMKSAFIYMNSGPHNLLILKV